MSNSNKTNKTKERKYTGMMCLNAIDSGQGAIRAIRFNVDGSYCLTCGGDRKIKLWNPYKRTLLKTYAGHGDEALDAAGSCDSSQLVSASADKSAIVWDVGTGRPLRRLRAHASAVSAVRLNEESTVAVTGSRDNSVMCWDLRSRKESPVQTFREAKDCITSVKVVGCEILTSSVDGRTRLYDLRNGRMTSDFLGAPVTFASMTRDGQCVVASAGDTLRLLDKTTGESLAEYVGHRTDGYSTENFVHFEDAAVFSGSADGQVWCWDLITAEVAVRFRHSLGGVVVSVDGHPGREVFLSAAAGEFKLWGMPEDV